MTAWIGRHPLLFLGIWLPATVIVFKDQPMIGLGSWAVGFWLAAHTWRTRRHAKAMSVYPPPNALPEAAVPRQHKQPSPGHAKSYVRAVYRDLDDRRPLWEGAGTYTFLWPHPEPAVPGTWVDLPAGDETKTGIIVGPGSPTDYAGQLKPVQAIQRNIPRVLPVDHYHRPPARNNLIPLEPWGPTDVSVKAEFLFLHQREMRAVFNEHGTALKDQGTSIKLDVQLIPADESEYPAVVVGGRWLGNITDPAVAPLEAKLRALMDSGTALTVPGNLWAFSDQNTLRGSLRLSVPTPTRVNPPGPLPKKPHVILPPGSKIQAVGEESHLTKLVAILDREPQTDVVAELYQTKKLGARSNKTVVGIRIYDEEVGELTPTMSAHFLPLLKACDAEGVAVCCRGVVKGNQLKADVILNAAKAQDLNDQWLKENLWPPSPPARRTKMS